MERTFIAIKPDAVKRKLISRILERFENKGYTIIGMKLMMVSRELAEKHYAEHAGKEYYHELVDFLTSGPIVAVCLEGINAIKGARILIGATNPDDADVGSIRADFGTLKRFNVIHGADSPEAAEREIKNFFSPEELIK